MKCPQCGTKFEGKFCPKCGEPSPVNNNTNETNAKKKKPIYKRAWFVILAIILVVLVCNRVSDFFKDRPEKIVWSDIVLGEILPEPESAKGKVIENSDNELEVKYVNVIQSEYNGYLEACLEKGFDIESERTSTEYSAYNKEGYKLELRYYDDEMTVRLEKPIEFNDIKWPASELGKTIPEPKSHIGKFYYEHDTEFSVIVGNTPLKEYDEYVSACMEGGFVVDYNKEEKNFEAKNADGYHISVAYAGFNVMQIIARAPAEDTKTDKMLADENEDNSTELDSNGLRPQFKKAMDSYESFMDEYVAFMKMYEKNPSDVQLLTEYSQYMVKYSQCCNDFEKWDDEDMNAAETAYYFEVQARVIQKLNSVAG